MKKTPIILLALSFLAPVVNAKDIGFGTLKWVKVYDFKTDKSLRIYFSDSATHLNQDCKGVACFTFSRHSSEFIDKVLSVAMAAQISGKKVRIHSEEGSCEGAFIALQETRF
ncbi:hypothetical protein [Vibrio nigripulchritudo]|uniref:hypothetical protein n=1 Tax=Vibrio nigripulchritudo TaxID=28173 RepID=UPI002491498F|nr:hypothetical protein [Vibrio nigripulchritudo]BDU40353.1 hypothetical protein TUMSATVNIG2_48220 [Vibrio nigripulchritudo]BDU46089.1 hypothetical protein TUMSATVNIG3_48870 [Vibrio nigripulchritudo]